MTNFDIASSLSLTPAPIYLEWKCAQLSNKHKPLGSGPLCDNLTETFTISSLSILEQLDSDYDLITLAFFTGPACLYHLSIRECTCSNQITLSILYVMTTKTFKHNKAIKGQPDLLFMIDETMKAHLPLCTLYALVCSGSIYEYNSTQWQQISYPVPLCRFGLCI